MNNLEVVRGKIFDIIGVADTVIAQMAENYLPLKINGIEDKAGYKAVHDARMVVKSTRVKVEKHGKEIREEAVKYQKAVIAEEKRLIGLMEPIETHLTAEEKAVDDALEAIKQAEIKKIEDRNQCRRERLAGRGVGFNGQIWTFGALNLPDAMLKVAADEQFEVLFTKFHEAIETDKARVVAEEAARKAEHERLEKIAAEQEVERQRLEVLAQAQEVEERKRRIQEKLEQEERERKNAEIRAEAERIADEKAEWERIKAEEIRAQEAAKQKIIDDERHAKELEAARKEAAEKARKDAEEKLKREAEAAAEKERLAKIAADKKEARRPDKEKLLTYANYIAGVPAPPELKTQEAKDIVIEAEMGLSGIIKTLREKAGVL